MTGASSAPQNLFEGSFLGDATRIAPDARLECGICWTPYSYCVINSLPAIGAMHV